MHSTLCMHVCSGESVNKCKDRCNTYLSLIRCNFYCVGYEKCRLLLSDRHNFIESDGNLQTQRNTTINHPLRQLVMWLVRDAWYSDMTKCRHTGDTTPPVHSGNRLQPPQVVMKCWQSSCLYHRLSSGTQKFHDTEWHCHTNTLPKWFWGQNSKSSKLPQWHASLNPPSFSQQWRFWHSFEQAMNTGNDYPLNALISPLQL